MSRHDSDSAMRLLFCSFWRLILLRCWRKELGPLDSISPEAAFSSSAFCLVGGSSPKRQGDARGFGSSSVVSSSCVSEEGELQRDRTPLVSTRWLSFRPFFLRFGSFRGAGKLVRDNLSKAGWSWGYVSAIPSKGRKISIADAHGDNAKHFVVRAGES